MTADEYNACVDLHADGVFRFILKNLRNEDKAKDIVQDAYEKLWRKVADVDAAKAKSYLFTTAYHSMIDMLRKERSFGDLDQVSDFTYAAENTFSDIKNVLGSALSKLSDIQRSVILLRDYEGYSYEEIGVITGLSAPQVKVYIYRARVFLKEYIGSPDRVI